MKRSNDQNYESSNILRDRGYYVHQLPAPGATFAAVLIGGGSLFGLFWLAANSEYSGSSNWDDCDDYWYDCD
jgi:hypothetical protein